MHPCPPQVLQRLRVHVAACGRILLQPSGRLALRFVGLCEVARDDLVGHHLLDSLSSGNGCVVEEDRFDISGALMEVAR